MAAALVAAMLTPAMRAHARGENSDQDTFTPMPLDAGFGRMDLSTPKIPPAEIIKEFSAKETQFRDALNNYTYRRMAKVETLNDDNKVDGEWYEVDDVIFDLSGKRVEKAVYAPESTLTRMQMTESDFQDIEHGYPFVLTDDKVPEYNINYVGKQRVDAVDCYVFDVSPKVLAKGERYLDGRIWVDATDLQIVVTDGRMVPDDMRKGHEDLHPPFMTWRQQIDGKYWFPVYTRAEGILHFSGGYGYMGQDIHVRDIIKYTDYKQYGSTSRILFAGKDITPPKGTVQGQTPANGQGPAATPQPKQ
ncbi:MAG TPA: hypothetical protein VFU55_01660 [Terracidiphilus sp.]|nr:hypothetical protein [Terracidiphilus sp.]